MVYFYQRTPTYPQWRVIICKESIHLAIIKKSEIARPLSFLIKIQTRNIFLLFTWPWHCTEEKLIFL